MHYLFLCILSSTGIFIVFKALDRFRIPVFPVILINYLLATLLGFLLNRGKLDTGEIFGQSWLPLSMAIGILFILMFFLVGASTRRAGISTTTVASKMSVVFPIVFSMIIDPSDILTPVKASAIICALAGVALTVFRKPAEGGKSLAVALPLILFIGMGVVDSLVKFSQHRFVGDADTPLFTAVLFLNALSSGLLILIFRSGELRHFGRSSTWGWGLLLGAVNFGSIFFMMKALNFRNLSAVSGLDSSLVFGVNNTGIVVLSVLTGLLVFGERLRPVNWLGIGISILSFILFSLG